MVAQSKIASIYDQAATEFAGSSTYQRLVSGQLSKGEIREFVANVVRTHYVSPHIIALAFASLPTPKGAELLKENLLEEMGLSDEGKAHPELLLDLAKGAGFTPEEIETLIEDSRGQIRTYCAQSIAFAALRDLGLAILLATVAFEFFLSRHSSKIGRALEEHYGIPKQDLEWFDLHSEVDIRHAEEGLITIQEYLTFHQIDDVRLEFIIRRAFAENVFCQKYFPDDPMLKAKAEA
jgi:pyrroloquinoline quinone (PQQ) biosynthesis protein C